ncbi:ankyrin-1-like [Orbicella faveolata]|uniref:ankyrin-1-like n=1 Tax=Orbicella faveolata TaxID=48498 RepID=UPI0009E5CFA7|nr:ankyrin-1-like [Orbicella faveolata]
MSCKSADKDQDPIQMGLDPSHQLKEKDIYNYHLPRKVGEKWRDLARVLGYSHTEINGIQKEQSSSIKECCIEVLVCWMRREGRNATVEKLAEALVKAELKDVADELMCMDTTQVRLP